MKVGGEYTFDGPQALVWDTLLDPQVLAAVLPGCKKLELVGDSEYEGTLRIQVGPVQGTFMAKVRLDDIQQPDSYTMNVDGRGAPGFLEATGHLTLAADGEKTLVTYSGEARVGGRLASVGQRLVETAAKAIIKQSLDGLNANVQARNAPTAADGEAPGPPPVEPPSQTEFAATIAKEVVKDVIPAPVRYGVAILIVTAALYGVYALLT